MRTVFQNYALFPHMTVAQNLDYGRRMYRLPADAEDIVLESLEEHHIVKWVLSELIGFVYSGMDAWEAANHFVRSIRQAAEPVLRKGSDALVNLLLFFFTGIAIVIFIGSLFAGTLRILIYPELCTIGNIQAL